MIRTVRLYGPLAEKYGDTHELWGDTVQMLVRGLTAQHHGMERELIEGEWSVCAGNIDDTKGRLEIEQDFVGLHLSDKHTEVHIMPAVDGAGRGLGLILGVALLFVGGIGAFGLLGGAAGGFGATAFSAFGMAVTWGNIAMFGLSLTLNGIASMMAPQPKLGAMPERPDEKPSYLFNGPVNVGEQGGPVPLVYGEFRTGSTTISAGLSTEQIPL